MVQHIAWFLACMVSCLCPSAKRSTGRWLCCIVGMCIVGPLEEEPVTNVSCNVGKSLGRSTKTVRMLFISRSDQPVTWWKEEKPFLPLFSVCTQHWGTGSDSVVKGHCFVIWNVVPTVEIQFVLSVYVSVHLFKSCQLQQPQEVQQKVCETPGAGQHWMPYQGWGESVVGMPCPAGQAAEPWPWHQPGSTACRRSTHSDRSGGSEEPESCCLAKSLVLGRTPRNKPRQNRTIPNSQINEGTP